jgi:hypothetical protein
LDITQLILDDHHEQRKMFALLDDVDRDDTASLDAISDHNDIREGIAEAERHDAGSPGWWQGLATTREANSKHMAEEERQALADFRLHADRTARHELGVAFAAFEAGHADGIVSVSKDPDGFIEAHR